MNFIVGIAGGIIGSYLGPSITEKTNGIYQYFKYPKKQINTIQEPISGMALFSFLINYIRQAKDYPDKCVIANFNIIGYTEIAVIPLMEYEYNEYYYYSLVSFGVKIIEGTTPDNYVYEVYGNYYHDKLSSIIEEYENIFYKESNNKILIPAFSSKISKNVSKYIYDVHWIFNPICIPNIYKKQFNDEVCEYILKNDAKGIILYGSEDSEIIFTTCLVGKRLQRKIYIPDNFFNPNNFISSIRKVPPNSIIMIKNIDEVFTKGLVKDNVNKDTIMGIFDFIATNVLVVFITNNIKSYDFLSRISLLSSLNLGPVKGPRLTTFAS